MARKQPTGGEDDEQDVGTLIQREFGKRISITSRKLTVEEARAVLARSGSYQFYKDLPKKELARLTANLVLDDRIFPAAILDEDEVLLDGHQRLMAFVEAASHRGPARLPVRIVAGLTADEKLWLVRSLNDNRRHLSSHDRQLSIARCLRKFTDAGLNPSDRSVARILAVDHKTVGACRQKMEAGNLDPSPRVGTDGVARAMPSPGPGSWVRLKQNYAAFQRRGKLQLVVDDLSSSKAPRSDAGALARLATELLSRYAALLLWTTPYQIADIIRGASKYLEYRWTWSVLMPQDLVSKDNPRARPAARFLIMFARPKTMAAADRLDCAFDMRKHGGKNEMLVLHAVLERLFLAGLAEMLPHVHLRGLPINLQCRLAEKCTASFYDDIGAKIE